LVELDWLLIGAVVEAMIHTESTELRCVCVCVCPWATVEAKSEREHAPQL